MTRGKRDGGEDERDAWRENSERRGRALGGAASAHTLRMCLHDSEGPQQDTVFFPAQILMREAHMSHTGSFNTQRARHY